MNPCEVKNINEQFVNESEFFDGRDGEAPLPDADAENLEEVPGKEGMPKETVGRQRRFIEIDSDYRDIEVFRYDSLCSLSFEHSGATQTRIDLEEPKRLVFRYTQMSFAGLLLTPQPKSILITGLGGGSIPRTFSDLFPDASIDVVELDQTIVGVAKKYFMFEETANMRVYVDDARAFVLRAGLQGRQYDYIVLDAFDDDIIPPQLHTTEFFEEVKRILSPGGVLVANTPHRFCRPELVTYQQVWGKFFQLDSVGNCVIITRAEAFPSQCALVLEAHRLAPRVEKYGIQLLEYPALMSTRVDWNQTLGRCVTAVPEDFEVEPEVLERIIASESDWDDW